MEVKMNIEYPQLLELIKQMPVNQLNKLIVDVKSILENERKVENTTTFQEFLLKAPTMSKEQYEVFKENRKLLSQWRNK
jgi:hypothetical protein